MKDAEPEWAEVDVPDLVVDLLETDVFAAENVTDVDPVGRGRATPKPTRGLWDRRHIELSPVNVRFVDHSIGNRT